MYTDNRLTTLESTIEEYRRHKRQNRRDRMRAEAEFFSWLLTDEPRTIYVLRCRDDLDPEIGTGWLYTEREGAVRWMDELNEVAEEAVGRDDDYYIEEKTMTGIEFAEVRVIDY